MPSRSPAKSRPRSDRSSSPRKPLKKGYKYVAHKNGGGGHYMGKRGKRVRASTASPRKPVPLARKVKLAPKVAALKAHPLKAGFSRRKNVGKKAFYRNDKTGARVSQSAACKVCKS